MKTFKSRPELFLWLSIAVYIVFFVTVSYLRHYLFLTQTWDLGAFVQMFWRASEGLGFGTPIEDATNHLGVHMSPFLYLLIPGYWFFRAPEYLLVVQTLALALAAIPLYYIGRLLLPSSKWPLTIAIAYLCYPSLHWINLFDFHEVPFFIPLALTAVYFFLRQRWWWSGLFFALAASVSENSIVAVGALGLYLAFSRCTLASNDFPQQKQRFIGLIIFVLSVVYLIVAVKILMPLAGGGFFRIDRYNQFGSSLNEIVVNMVTRPDILFGTLWQWGRLQYVAALFLPVILLPFFSRWAFITLIPGLAQNLLSTFSFQTSNFYQYDATLLPALWLTVLIGLQHPWIAKIRERRLFYGFFWLIILAALLLRSPLNPYSLSSLISQPTERTEAYREYIKVVPDNVSVTAPTNLIPHLSNRQYAFMLGNQKFETDIIIVDTHDYFGFSSQQEFVAYVQSLAQSGIYEIGQVAEGYILFYRPNIKLNGQ